VSPHQYILARRIERAKSMLRDPRHSIVDVALACGFSSQAHLSAMFKRSTGVTPGTYRKG
jgi:AraC family transcriptional regulator